MIAQKILPMPIYYHYTCGQNLLKIFQSRKLTLNAIQIDRNAIYRNMAVCLTTDPSSIGHGLPDGREISDAVAERLNEFRLGDDGRKYCRKHTMYRIEIELADDNPMLVTAISYHSLDLDFLKFLEVLGYFPVAESISNLDYKQGQKNILNGTWIGKSATWMYYFAEIPVLNFLSIGVQNSTGSYKACTWKQVHTDMKAV